MPVVGEVSSISFRISRLQNFLLISNPTPDIALGSATTEKELARNEAARIEGEKKRRPSRTVRRISDYGGFGSLPQAPSLPASTTKATYDYRDLGFRRNEENLDRNPIKPNFAGESVSISGLVGR